MLFSQCKAVQIYLTVPLRPYRSPLSPLGKEVIGMGNLPKPYKYGSLPQDCVDDYLRAGSDKDRRNMLLLFGYDQKHLSEVRRLFPEFEG